MHKTATWNEREGQPMHGVPFVWCWTLPMTLPMTPDQAGVSTLSLSLIFPLEFRRELPQALRVIPSPS